MDVQTVFLANDQQPILDSVAAALAEYSEACFVVAYGTHGGFNLLESTRSLSRFLESGHRLRVLLDADRHFTDPELINELATFPGDVEVRLFAPRARNVEDHAPPTGFHPKVYYFESDETACAIVGSSNFSPGGLKFNAEAAVEITGPIRSPVFDDIRNFVEAAWNSPYQIGVLDNPAFMQAYEEAYGAAKERQVPQLPAEAPAYQTEEDVSVLRAAAAAGAAGLQRSITAYLVGLISAHYRAGDLRKRSVTIQLQRGLLRRGTPHEGQVYFEDVSERGFDQRDCVRRDAERIGERLRRAFDRLGSGDSVGVERRSDLTYRLHLRFARRSSIWGVVRNELRNAGSDRTYLWPQFVNLDDNAERRAFVQGYMDLRTRISATDALPPPQRIMRLAVSVGGNAPPDFAADLRRLMAAEFQCDPDQINLLDGSSRGRESIIRIDARLIPLNYLESHWQRIVVEDFREYNHRITDQ